MTSSGEDAEGGGLHRRTSQSQRDIRTLFALSGAVGAAFIPFFALLLKDRGFSPVEIGVVLAASSLAGVGANPFWSDLADARLGSVMTLRLAAIASAGFAVALIFTGSILWATLTVAALLGAADGPMAALIDAIALTHLGPARTADYGTIRLWASGGWAVAVLAFGALFQRVGLGPMLPAFAVGLTVYSAYTVRFPAIPPDRAVRERSRLGSVGEAFRSNPRLLPFLAGLLLVTTATSAAWAFLPLRIASRGGGPFLIGVAAGLSAVLEIPFMLSSARLGRLVGFRTLYVAGIAVYIALMLTWSVVGNAAAIALITTARGAGFGLAYVAVVVIAGRLVPERLQNTGQVLQQTTTMGIAPVTGAALGGLVYGRLGAPALFAGAAALAIAGTFVVWLVVPEDV